MKYLKEDIYTAAVKTRDSSAWHKAYTRYEKEFFRIKHKFQKDLVTEMLEGHAFHDSGIRQFSVESSLDSYSLYLVLKDGFKPGVLHYLAFHKVDCVRTNECFGDDWLFCELLPQKKGRFSLEAVFADGGTLYIEFEGLEYKKETRAETG